MAPVSAQSSLLAEADREARVDALVDKASNIHRGESWLDSLCIAAGAGMAVICGEDGEVEDVIVDPWSVS
jgi:hypothetical protein